MKVESMALASWTAFSLVGVEVGEVEVVVGEVEVLVMKVESMALASWTVLARASNSCLIRADFSCSSCVMRSLFSVTSWTSRPASRESFSCSSSFICLSWGAGGGAAAAAHTAVQAGPGWPRPGSPPAPASTSSTTRPRGPARLDTIGGVGVVASGRGPGRQQGSRPHIENVPFREHILTGSTPLELRGLQRQGINGSDTTLELGCRGLWQGCDGDPLQTPPGPLEHRGVPLDCPCTPNREWPLLWFSGLSMECRRPATNRSKVRQPCGGATRRRPASTPRGRPWPWPRLSSSTSSWEPSSGEPCHRLSISEMCTKPRLPSSRMSKRVLRLWRKALGVAVVVLEVLELPGLEHPHGGPGAARAAAVETRLPTTRCGLLLLLVVVMVVVE
ncbi:hypothetical protein CRUP_004932 [Coryphaenoides rupestris]|nr:hypothetical protein CRUP_004932 [Coryphaenoides rupestris]